MTEPVGFSQLPKMLLLCAGAEGAKKRSAAMAKQASTWLRLTFAWQSRNLSLAAWGQPAS